MKLKIYGAREENNPIYSYYVALDSATVEESYISEKHLPIKTVVLTELVGEIDIGEDVLRGLDGLMRNQQPGLVAFFDNRGTSYLKLKVLPLSKILQP